MSAPSVRCTDFRPFEKNTLQGFAAFELLGCGLIVKDCPVHQKNGSRWVAFPGRPYTDKNTGATTYANIIDYASSAAKQAFQQAALAALDAYMKGAGQ